MDRNYIINSMIAVFATFFGVSQIASAQGFPGGMDLTDTQKSCLENLVGKPSGGPPQMDKIKAAFEKCGINPPSGSGGSPVARRESAPVYTQMVKVTESVENVQKYVTGLQSFKGSKNQYIRLVGSMPKKCVEKINLSVSCDELENKIDFTFSALSADAIACLKNNQSLCKEKDSIDCTQLDQIAANSKDKFKNRVDAKVSDKECKGIDLNSVSVAILSKPYVAAVATKSHQDRSKTEGVVCEVCEARGQAASQVDRLKESVSEISQKVQEQPRPQTLAQQPPPVDTEDIKRHMERQKDRMIKKIKSGPCKMPGEDDEDFDPSEMASMGGGMPDMGKGKPGMGTSGGDMSKMFAGNLEFMDDIQDAMDAKMEKCQKEMKRKMSSKGQMPGGMAGGQQQMGGMGSMMGSGGMGSSMIAGMAGGQQQMGGMGSMMGYSGMGNSMMGGMGSMMGYSGMGNSMMGGMGSMMGYVGMSNSMMGYNNLFSSPYQRSLNLYSSPYQNQSGYRYNYNTFGMSSR